MDCININGSTKIKLNSNEQLPVGERKSKYGTIKAGSEPRPISETTEAITELRMTIEVVFVNDKRDSSVEGHNTDSTAKKQPATAALNPTRKNKSTC